MHCGADVTVSLTYEPGRAAFAGRGARSRSCSRSRPEHVALPARDDHYAGLALHDVERGLFESGAPQTDPGGAVELLEGGGERAELELVAARAASLIRDEDFAPEDIAVVMRAPEDHAPLLADVFATAGVPVALGRRVPAGHLARPRARRAVALRPAGRLGRRPARLAAHAGQASSGRRLPTGWRPTPAVRARARRPPRERCGRTRIPRSRWPRSTASRPRARAAPRPLSERLAAEAAALFAAPWRGRAPVLSGADALDARVAGALRAALGELAALAERDPALAPPPAELARTLEALEVSAGARAGAVEVTSPDRIRARRVRALFVCGLQEKARFRGQGR